MSIRRNTYYQLEYWRENGKWLKLTQVVIRVFEPTRLLYSTCFTKWM